MKNTHLSVLLISIALLFSCIKTKEPPTLTTTNPSNTTINSVTSGGNITNGGGADITSRGVCWSTSPNPVASGPHTTDGVGTGSFTSNITGLTPGTKYYIKAYAVNSAGTGYGNEVSFTTTALAAPTLTTVTATEVTQTSAKSGGTITSDGGDPITVKGVCWGTGASPTVNGSKTSDGSGSSAFASNLSGLTPGTTYYYRSYATNSVGTGYGNELSFTTACSPPAAPVVGTITQPTCTIATGSVVLSGLPSSGAWTITRTPGGTTTTGTGTTTTITGLTASTTFTFTVTNATGCLSASSVNVVMNAQPVSPTAPVVGTVTQPTCAIATGSVGLNGLPSSGTWTITRTPGGTINTGSGTTTTITGLSAGTTFSFTVTNSSGCASGPSANVVINAQTSSPTAPVIGAITQPTCAVATGSVVLSGLPSAGTWTLTRTPGGTTTTGTGTAATVTGLTAGITYSFTVTNSSGCVSASSANVAINAQPSAPTAPVIGTITQPTCAVPTGSVVLNGLPSNGTWTITRTPGGTTTIGTGTTATVTALPAGTTYSFTVTNSSGCISAASGNVIINAQPASPTGTTNAATNITASTATLNGTINANGSSTTVTFEYGLTTSYGSSISATPGTVTGSANTAVIANISGLTINSIYHFRVMGVNCGGPTNSNDQTFTTLTSTTPALTTTGIGSITATSAISGGSITDAGGGSITAKGVCWSTATGPVATGNHTSDGTGTGTYSSSITGLTPNTTYYVRAYATNGAGTGYGNEVTFRTFAATDADGNNYTSINIGSQTWLVENLKTTRYSNGDLIGTTAPATLDLTGATTPAYQWSYGGNETYVPVYGRLYTWYAITETRGICPTGWHVPSYDETITLATNIGGANVAGGKLKETGTVHWSPPNSFATDDFGFKGLPGGGRDVNGAFGNINNIGNWWTSTSATNTANANYRGLDYQSAGFGYANYDKRAGFSVRCVKD